MKSLYNGYIPSILGIMPYTAINFEVYNILRDLVANYNQKDPIAVEMLWCGMVFCILN